MTRAQEAEERFGLKREVAKLKRLMSKKSHDSLSDESSQKSEEDNKRTDEDNRTEGEYEISTTSTISENHKEEFNDSTDGGDKRTREQVSPDKVFSEVCMPCVQQLSLTLLYNFWRWTTVCFNRVF